MALLSADDVLNKKFQATKFREGYEQDDVDEFLQSGKVVDVARVEAGAMCVGGGSDEQVHDPSPGSAAEIDDGGSEAAVADGDGFVYGQGVEVLLQEAETAQALGADRRGLGDQYPEMEFSQGDCADREHAGNRCEVAGDDDACVQDGSFDGLGLVGHWSVQGLRSSSSRSCRSCSQSGSSGPWNISAISAQERH